MKNRDILNAAISLCGELRSSGFFGDYEERTTAILPLVISHFEAKDRAWRRANGLGEQTENPSSALSLDSEFPLSRLFETPAAAMLASLVVSGENPEMSDRLNDLSLRTAKTITLETPMISEKIAEQYTF